jgi:hypothetical protein
VLTTFVVLRVCCIDEPDPFDPPVAPPEIVHDRVVPPTLFGLLSETAAICCPEQIACEPELTAALGTGFIVTVAWMSQRNHSQMV